MTISTIKILEDAINKATAKAKVLIDITNELGLHQKIEGVCLTQEHVGRKVIYIPRHAGGDINHKDVEHGTIRSWNDGGVFVDYVRNVCRTDYSDLRWDKVDS